jgi:hypothetical protein
MVVALTIDTRTETRWRIDNARSYPTKPPADMRARSEPVRAFSTKDEAVRFAGRQLGGNYAVYHKDRKIWPIP